VAKQARGYESPERFYVEKIVEGCRHHRRGLLAEEGDRAPLGLQVQRIPQPHRRRKYEPTEENPMLGFRGASRYIAQSFRDCFRLECEAMRKVRDAMGLTNVELMIPFVRTVKEGEQVLAILKGLRARARQERAAHRDDVRDPVQRDPRRRVPQALRRLLRSAPTT
jgi:pyruvate,water dikinase